MFKIVSLTLYKEESSYEYTFKVGVNHFIGTNSTGKTEFYNFIDYMFGKTDETFGKEWFKDINKANLKFEYNKNEYSITRNLGFPNKNAFICKGKLELDSISELELKNKINSVFMLNVENQRNIEEFTGENITFRSFTVFNFLSEKNQGKTYDFLTKTEDLKYALKLPIILNYIFNPNIQEIKELKKEIDGLIKEIKKIEVVEEKKKYTIEQINIQLGILNIPVKFSYSPKTISRIKSHLDLIKKDVLPTNRLDKSIVDLQNMLINVDQQIKTYNNQLENLKIIKTENEKRNQLFLSFNKLIEKNNHYNYLIEPLKELISNTETNISFTTHYINNNTLDKLIAQRKNLINELNKRDAELSIYKMGDVNAAILLLEKNLEILDLEKGNLKELKQNLVQKKRALRELQNSDDVNKIKMLSRLITQLYLSSNNVSNFVQEDFKSNIYLQYRKKGNLLQPMIQGDEIYTGSMARHTLMQLSGYFGFIQLLIKENKYPFIPFLCIDHISKPFDSHNIKVLGEIIKQNYKMISKENFQIFIFDEKTPEDFGYLADNVINLDEDGKSGFVPFYKVKP